MAHRYPFRADRRTEHPLLPLRTLKPLAAVDAL
jgi:hypothetical protein